MPAWGRYLEIRRAVVPDSVKTAMARMSRSWAACAADSQMVSEMERGAPSRRRRKTPRCMWSSASATMRAMMATASRGYLPAAVSAESMTASVPSKMALATSEASARVGRGFSIMDSSIWVAVMTGLRQSAARRMTCFWMMGTFSGATSTPRSPRATITPSATSRISSRCSMAWGFSSLAITGTPAWRAAMSRLASRTPSAVRTKETATRSTPCFRPNSRSSWSFSVTAGTRTTAPGRLMPLCSPSRPPLMTSHSRSSPRTARTRSSMRPSASRMREPASTSRASSGKVVERTEAVPGTSRGVRVSSEPALSATGVRYFRRPVRILGPERSWRMPRERPSRSAARRRRSMRRACSSCVPMEERPVAHAFGDGVGMEQGVELGSHQHDDGKNVHPDQQGDGGAEGAVDEVVGGHRLHVPGEDHRGGEPQSGGHAGAGQHAMPGLRSRQAVMVDEGDDGDAGQGGDGPAPQCPQEEDEGPDLPPTVQGKPGLELIAKGYQQGGEGHGHEGEKDEEDGDGALLPHARGLGEAIGAAEAIHPGDHDAGGGQQRDEGSGDEQARGPLLSGVEVGDGLRGRPRRQHGAHGGGHLADEDVSLLGVRKGAGHHQQQRKQREGGGVGGGLGDGKAVVLEGAP